MISSKVLAAACLGAAVLAGCGVNVHSATIRGTAYVRVDAVIKRHPLYPQLSQLDDAINAIDLAAAAPRVPLSASQIAQQVKVLNRELREAQDRANKILAQKQQQYAKREQEAVAAALAAAGVPGAGAYAAQQMSATSAQQAQQAAAAANSDFMAYQQGVIEQGNAASSAVARQLQMQEAQQYRAMAMQLQQKETDLSLKLTQQDAQQRLAIKTKLNNLAMDQATRQRLTSQLAALQRSEDDQIAAQRRTDEAALRAYKAQLDRKTADAIRAQVGAINDQTRAKIAERQNEVGAQLRSLGPPPLPANLPQGTKAKIEQIHKQYQVQFQADARGTIKDYMATKADLDRQFAALHGADVGATGAAAKELDALQKRRDGLYKQIVAQIERDARRIGAQRGFTVVFDHVLAAPGGYDLTNDITKDIESQHE